MAKSKKPICTPAEMGENLGDYAENLPSLLERAMYRAAMTVERRAKQNISGPILNVDTNRLRSSVRGTVRSTQTETVGVVGTNVKYGRIHELGGWTGRGHKVFLRARRWLGISYDETKDEIWPDIGKTIQDGGATSGVEMT